MFKRLDLSSNRKKITQKSNFGLTLVEMLIGLAIFSISTLAIVGLYRNFMANDKKNKIKNDLQDITSALVKKINCEMTHANIGACSGESVILFGQNGLALNNVIGHYLISARCNGSLELKATDQTKPSDPGRIIISAGEKFCPKSEVLVTSFVKTIPLVPRGGPWPSPSWPNVSGCALAPPPPDFRNAIFEQTDYCAPGEYLVSGHGECTFLNVTYTHCPSALSQQLNWPCGTGSDYENYPVTSQNALGQTIYGWHTACCVAYNIDPTDQGMIAGHLRMHCAKRGVSGDVE